MPLTLDVSSKSIKPCIDDLFIISQRDEILNNIYYHHMMPIIGCFADIKFIYEAYQLLKDHDKILMFVGSNHAIKLREYLTLDARFNEQVAEGKFDHDKERVAPLSIERYKNLCDEWIGKNNTPKEVYAQWRIQQKKIGRKKIIRNVVIATTVAAAVVGTAWWFLGWKKTQKRTA